jgi:hypothetical protein
MATAMGYPTIDAIGKRGSVRNCDVKVPLGMQDPGHFSEALRETLYMLQAVIGHDGSNACVSERQAPGICLHKWASGAEVEIDSHYPGPCFCESETPAPTAQIQNEICRAEKT